MSAPTWAAVDSFAALSMAIPGETGPESAPLAAAPEGSARPSIAYSEATVMLEAPATVLMH